MLSKPALQKRSISTAGVSSGAERGPSTDVLGAQKRVQCCGGRFKGIEQVEEMTFQTRRPHDVVRAQRPDAGALTARCADATGGHLLPLGEREAGLKVQGAGGGVRIKRVAE
jgi:hypothetical protein